MILFICPTTPTTTSSLLPVVYFPRKKLNPQTWLYSIEPDLMIRPAQFNSYYLFIHLRIHLLHADSRRNGMSRGNRFSYMSSIYSNNENHKKEHEPLTEMHSLQFLSQETNNSSGLNIVQGSRRVGF